MTKHKLAATVAEWVRTHSAIGAKCGNCGKPFTVARKPKSVAGIPNAVNDAKLATMLHALPVGGAA